MKWHRPQAYFIPPVPTSSMAAGGDLSSPLYSDDGRYVCHYALEGSVGWCIVEDPFLHARVDGEVLEPDLFYYFDGDIAWEGGGWTLCYSIAHRAWILHNGSLGSVPVAYRDWATREWKGGAWYEGHMTYAAGRAFTFSPKGTLLNGDSPESKTVELFLPRWEWEDDGYSSAPIGKYVGKDGCTGEKYIGSAAYAESGTNYVWFRKEEGRNGYIQRENSDERSTARQNFRGFGYGWGIARGDLYYLAAALPTGEGGATFAPYRWDAGARQYVAAGDADPIELTYKGRTMGKTVVDGYFTETMLWR